MGGWPELGGVDLRQSALGKRNPGAEEVFKREKRTSESSIRGKCWIRRYMGHNVLNW